MQQDCNFFALSVIDNSPSVNLIVIKTAIICHNHLSSPYYCVCAMFLPPSSSQMRLNNAIPSNMEYVFISIVLDWNIRAKVALF